MITLKSDHRSVGLPPALGLMIALSVLFIAGCGPSDYYAPTDPETDITDYQFLSNYGEWIDDSEYGLVWHPWVVPEWSPFRHGHWAWTDYGWTWISYEPFGVMVYHYGFWDYTIENGWVWIPDDIWSPARVEWYTLDGYCAWAPMPPPGAIWHDPWHSWVVDPWVVVPMKRFPAEDVGQYSLDKRLRADIIDREDAVRAAPRIRQVDEATERRITKIDLDEEQWPIGREVIKRRVSPERAREDHLKRLILSDTEREKVDRHRPKVNRDVLDPGGKKGRRTSRTGRKGR